MKSSQTNIEKSFRKGIVVLIMILIALMTIVLNKNKNSDISGFLVGLPLLISGVIGIIGSIQAIKGLKEKKTPKMIFAILINFGIVLIFIGLIVTNIMDFVKISK